jgi:regulator of protease activity HflC (stomatin/prohibitin superfamily)
MQTVAEFRAKRINGFVALTITILLGVADYKLFQLMSSQHPAETELVWAFALFTLFIGLVTKGFFVIQPNEAGVLVFVGRYIGSVREAGFWWANPFAIRKHVSLRIHNFNSDKIKVNDLHGNPIEIAAVIVWGVVDSARALFDVQDYERFVAVQSETAIRSLASEYPYDAQDEERASLRGNPREIAENLQKQLQSRLEIAGVNVIESRISHLAYAQEIAQAMLRRQQAQAIIAARQKIVDGAVGMVQSALRALSEQHIVQLDEDKKATMVNNLLVALVAEREVQPVINTGTLYQ